MRNIKCPQCGYINQVSSAACIECGSPLLPLEAKVRKDKKAASRWEHLKFRRFINISLYAGRTIEIPRISRYKTLLGIAFSAVPYGLIPIFLYFTHWRPISTANLFLPLVSSFLGLGLLKINGVRFLHTGGFAVSTGRKSLVFNSANIRKLNVGPDSGKDMVEIFVKDLDDPVTLEFKSEEQFKSFSEKIESMEARGSTSGAAVYR